MAHGAAGALWDPGRRTSGPPSSPKLLVELPDARCRTCSNRGLLPNFERYARRAPKAPLTACTALGGAPDWAPVGNCTPTPCSYAPQPAPQPTITSPPRRCGKTRPAMRPAMQPAQHVTASLRAVRRRAAGGPPRLASGVVLELPVTSEGQNTSRGVADRRDSNSRFTCGTMGAARRRQAANVATGQLNGLNSNSGELADV